ncbi:MAG: hypothetical protein U0176_22330 [Bacteroidia bacterium]
MNARLNILDSPSLAARQPVRAAFLRGSDLLLHLAEIQRWGIPLLQLEAYWVPESLSSRAPSGLLVILPEGRVPSDLLQPCTMIGGRLVIPVGTAIFPETNAAELDRVVRFPRAFWHPILGMIGLENSDRLNWADAVAILPEKPSNWQHGHPGLAPPPKLEDAKVLRPPGAGDIMDELRGGRGTKSLDDLGGGKEMDDSALGRFRDGLFKGALSMTRGLMGQFPEGVGGGPGYNAFSRFAGWLGSQLQGSGGGAGGAEGGGSGGMQGRREDAIDKLLEMLERNLEEALKYAIPLDNPFADRGVGTPGSDLGQRNTNFNWGNFGGTTSSGTWGLDGNRYQTLRERYRKAANEALAAGDFEKAAYIFAHLLHDFSAAANALEQGKRYRDAAKIYKDYLKNPAAAAQCLERGGLYLEAIDIYLELSQWEKAGDLYKTLGLEEKSKLQYERCLDDFISKANYMDAAEFVQKKMDRLDRALTYLVLGWHDGQRSEACLRRYLQLVNVKGVDMRSQIAALWQKQTPFERRPLFLEILADLQPQLREADAKAYSRELAFQYLSEQVQAGDRSRLHRLRDFVPADKLLPTDVSRFVSRQIHRPKRETFSLSLMKDVFWYNQCNLGYDNISLGLKGNQLWLSRWNWDGNVEYYHFTEVVPEDDRCQILLTKGAKRQAVLLSPMGATYTTKHLASGSAFKSALQVLSAAQVPSFPELLGGWVNSENRLSLVCIGSGGVACLRDIGLDGTLFSTVDLTDEASKKLVGLHDEWIGEFLPIDGGYLGMCAHYFVLIAEDARVGIFPLSAHGRLMDVWHGSRLAYETDEGIFAVAASASGIRQGANKICDYNGSVMDMRHLSDGRLVVAWENEIWVFLSDVHHNYSGVSRVDINGLVSAIVPGNSASRFVLQMTDGRLLPYRIEEGNRAILTGW